MKSFKQKNVKVQISLFSKITDCYLFEIGEDIEISRKENELKCLCKKEDYDLQGYENILLDKEKGKNVEFTPKRIQVIQFYETEYQKQKHQSSCCHHTQLKSSNSLCILIVDLKI